ncbi:MAG: preprotein translocase subunit SecG [Gammaproteobacteria bacterium]|nr:preprotein translocase subunit SecG [Gammaproteobacteria bacterium]
MYTALVILLVLVSAALIGLILLQQGKGADAGAAFGSGASGTVFGARGSANFLSHATAGLAAAFFILTLVLAYFVRGDTGGSVVSRVQQAVPKPAISSSPAPEPAAGPSVVPPPAAPAHALTAAPKVPAAASTGAATDKTPSQR